MVIGSEARNHGIQFFDMNKLLDIDPRSPKNFSITADVTGLFTDLPVGRTHNVVVNEELGYAVSVVPNLATALAELGSFSSTSAMSPSLFPQAVQGKMATFMMLNVLFTAVQTSVTLVATSATATMKILSPFMM